MNEPSLSSRRIVVIGGGFAGLSAAYELTRLGHRLIVLEADDPLGGLAASFRLSGADQPLEWFYHHWFTNDVDALDLCRELGIGDALQYRASSTGTWCDGRVWRLSTPMDLLKFKPLGLLDRFRLGGLVLKARRVKDWRELENRTAASWLTDLAGPRVYKTVWEPLLRGKFGPYAEEISAVWLWNKLCLRGSSRGKGGRETLVYPHGGFERLIDALTKAIRDGGGEVRTHAAVTGLEVAAGSADTRRITGVRTAAGVVPADVVIATPALPLLADLIQPHDTDYAARCRKIDYLAALCLVLELRKPLSQTYWMNVNDAEFPYVGIIEHTNFEPPASYGRHIVYLSKYLPADAPLYAMSDDDVLAHSLPHMQRLMPAFTRQDVLGHHVFRARYAQPVVVRHYSGLIPPPTCALAGLHVASMAQIYPKDRGTSYAIRQGRHAAREVCGKSCDA
ncbi:MAG: NAD(P)/FAD-dependent oxidoreductase [Phycisphaerae bacterium]|nr:NAD(P)/FAD-dependent oxidoreductase [Phycisphaerae bacterium]